MAEEGLKVIESVYPKPMERPDAPAGPRPQLGSPDRVLLNQGTSAIVLAVDLNSLVLEAQRVDGVIAFVPSVGDFVAAGEPLFLLYGGAAAIGATTERTLRGSVAFGPERTIERTRRSHCFIVDIAIKALSKAINDPTTAVLAIDQLHRLLRNVGQRHLHDEQISDGPGGCAYFSRRQIGRTLCSSLAGRSAYTARRIFRSPGACAR